MIKIEYNEYTKRMIQTNIENRLRELNKELENIAYHEMNLDMGRKCLIISIISLLVSLLSLTILIIILIR